MTTRSRAALLLVLLSAFAAGACAHRAGSAGAAADEPPDPLSKLRREIADLASPRGCKASAQCKAAPVGYNPCGGPRNYIVYCPLTTDEGALSGKLRELLQAEKERAAKSAPGDRCAPTPAVVAEAASGVCRAKER